MFRLFKQVFILLISIRRSLATKCVSLNYEPCMTRPNLFDLNPNELYYYWFLVSWDRYNESYNTLDN